MRGTSASRHRAVAGGTGATSRRRWARRTVALVVLAVVAAVAAAGTAWWAPDGEGGGVDRAVSSPGGASVSPSPSPVPSPTTSAGPGTETPEAGPTPDPDAPSGWGPTIGELETARVSVAAMSPSRLAGAVIVGRFRGTDPSEAAAMVRRLHLAGLSVTSENVTDETQLRALTEAVTGAAEADGQGAPPVLGVDQEGGTVEALRGVATSFPAFAEAGDAIVGSPHSGARVVRRAADAAGLELRDLGFTWVFGPVADVTIGPADPTIGTRSASTDPAVVTRAVEAALAGYDRAGLVTTIKHFPGHGAVTVDSHLALPELDETLPQLRRRDLPPFESAVVGGVPAVMMGHIAVDDLDPGVPASLSRAAYDLLRDEVGFEGVAITDSLGMGAVVGRETPAVNALRAGADLLLMPADTEATHATVTDAIRSGAIDRVRVEEAAARVVALRAWQQRVADARPVPTEVTAVAAEASAALAAAGS